jgi:hypothetical protein
MTNNRPPPLAVPDRSRDLRLLREGGFETRPYRRQAPCLPTPAKRHSAYDPRAAISAARRAAEGLRHARRIAAGAHIDGCSASLARNEVKMPPEQVRP